MYIAYTMHIPSGKSISTKKDYGNNGKFLCLRFGVENSGAGGEAILLLGRAGGAGGAS